MRGERFLWYKVASHLKMTLQRCQQETTSTEFLEWLVYLEIEEANNIEYHYLAQIACEIRRLFSKKPNSIKIKDFILKFITKKDKPKITKEEATKRDQAYWFKLLKFKPKE